MYVLSILPDTSGNLGPPGLYAGRLTEAQVRQQLLPNRAELWLKGTRAMKLLRAQRPTFDLLLQVYFQWTCLSC